MCLVFLEAIRWIDDNYNRLFQEMQCDGYYPRSTMNAIKGGGRARAGHQNINSIKLRHGLGLTIQWSVAPKIVKSFLCKFLLHPRESKNALFMRVTSKTMDTENGGARRRRPSSMII